MTCVAQAVATKPSVTDERWQAEAIIARGRRFSITLLMLSNDDLQRKIVYLNNVQLESPRYISLQKK